MTARTAVVVAAATLLAAAPAPAPAQTRFGGPVAGPGGAVRWIAPADSTPAWLAALPHPPRSAREAAVTWLAVAAADSVLEPYALRALGRARLAAHDTAGADSAFAAGAARPSLWHWPLVEARAGIAARRAGPAAADSLLAAADRGGWPDADRAAWLAARARIAAEAGDGARAESFLRQVVRVYPALPAARAAAHDLDRRLALAGARPSWEDSWAAAEAERLGGARAAAERRLARALAAAPDTQRTRVAVRIAELRRLLRRPGEAARMLDLAMGTARTAAESAAVILERARTVQAAGLTDSALALHARAAAAADSTRREAMTLELAREAERAGRWDLALEALGRVAAGGGASAAHARFRAGLVHYAAGRSDSALARWEGESGEGPLFWSAIALRARARQDLDTTAARLAAGRAAGMLATLAARPGYTFHRGAARDTLGTSGWPGAAPLAAGAGPPAVRAARLLLALGLDSDAASLLSRWNAGDPRIAPAEPAPEDRIAAAAAASAAGAVPLAIGIADRAVRALDEALDARAWPAVPWLYPDAYGALADARPAGLDPALILGVIRQESRFDPRARSVSDALGLMQLKLPTAREVAGQLGERSRVTAEQLFEPARNVRYGSAYLRRLIARFGGSTAAGLSAYNAGPGTIPPHYAALLARGGEALFAEFASNAIAQDYIRKILPNRDAYRELRAGRRRSQP